MESDETHYGVYDRATGELAYPLTHSDRMTISALIGTDGFPADRFEVRAYDPDSPIPTDLHERFPEDVRTWLAGMRLRGDLDPEPQEDPE